MIEELGENVCDQNVAMVILLRGMNGYLILWEVLGVLFFSHKHSMAILKMHFLYMYEYNGICVLGDISYYTNE